MFDDITVIDWTNPAMPPLPLLLARAERMRRQRGRLRRLLAWIFE